MASNNTNKNLIDSINDLIDVNKQIASALNTQNSKKSKADTEEELKKQENFLNGVSNFGKSVDSLKNSITSVINTANKLVEPWAKADQAAAEFAKTVGTSVKGMNQLRKETINFVANNNIASYFGKSADEMIKLQNQYVNLVGRNIAASKKGLENFAAAASVIGDAQATEMISKMEAFGVSMERSGSMVGKMFDMASKKGISAEKVIKNMVGHLDMAQKYAFKEGTKGLSRMAEKAAAINLEMSQASSFAEKVNSLEGAVSAGASLQVLGGPFAAFANPLQMLNESLTDLEGLQDRMIKMFGGFGHLNTVTGEVSVADADKVRIRAAAEAMGLDYGNIMESIYTAGRGNFIGQQIKGKGWTSDEQELIKNIGYIRDNQAYVSVGGREINARNLTAEQLKTLKELNQSESEDIKDIAKMLRGMTEIQDNGKKQAQALMAQAAENTNIGTTMKDIYRTVTDSNEVLKLILGLLGGAGLISAVDGVTGKIAAKRAAAAAGKKATTEALKKVAMKEAIRKGGVKIGTNAVMVDGVPMQVTKKGLKKMSQKQAAKYAGKNVARVLSKTGAGIMKGANVAGWAGLIGEIATEYAVGTGKMKKGGVAEYGAQIGSQVLGYGALGAAIAGPIGAAVGTAIGGTLGTIRATKHKRERELEEAGLSLKGEYSARQLKQIQEAISGNGELSDKLKEKIEKNGDFEALNRLDEIKKNIYKVQIVDSKKRSTGGIVSGPGSSTSDSIVTMLSNGESVMTARATKMYGPLLSALNQSAGGSSDFGVIKPNYAMLSKGAIDVKAPSPIIGGNSNVRGEINIKFSPIKVEFPNGTSKDMTEQLLSSPTFITALTRKIEEGLNRSENGGRLTNRKGLKYFG